MIGQCTHRLQNSTRGARSHESASTHVQQHHLGRWLARRGWLGFTDIAVGDLNNDGKNDLIGRMPNRDIWFTPNIGGGNGITWGRTRMRSAGHNERLASGAMNSSTITSVCCRPSSATI
jgi:hypothetical protein